MSNMTPTGEIINLLKILVDTKNPQVEKYLIINDTVKLFSGSSQLVEINNDQLKLCGHNLLYRLLAKKDKLARKLKSSEFANFMHNISNSFLRLNHLGISYPVEDLDREAVIIKNILSGTEFILYEEPSGDPNVKWLFAGKILHWQSPLFEIVLTKDAVIPENLWRPHFQIDIDTKLEQEKLEELLIASFGKNFIQWKLDIPNYGVVLEMGMLGSVNDTKIYLGVGTNLRNTKYHREKILLKFL